MAKQPLRTSSFLEDNTSKLIPGLKAPEGRQGHTEEEEDIVESLRKASSLIKKDRVDARRLGMESLALLTDPMRVGVETATIASRVVLLGSTDVDIGMGDNVDDVETHFDETAGLGICNMVLEITMRVAEEKMASMESGDFIEKEFTDKLFSICLTVLGNALHATAAPSHDNQAEIDDSSDSDNDRKASSSNSSNIQRMAVEHVSQASSISKQFIDNANSIFAGDILSSLIQVLGQARTNPHDAYRSARCLNVLFKGCGDFHLARSRSELGAKRALDMALEVGKQSHVKLEAEIRKTMKALW